MDKPVVEKRVDPVVKKASAFSLMRIVHALRYSAKGVKYAWLNEAAFRQEVFLAVVFIPLGFWLGNTAVERVLLVGVCFFVLIVELLNTGIEVVVDRISLDRHELSGVAKDLGSAAVMLGLLMWGLTWLSIIGPRFF